MKVKDSYNMSRLSIAAGDAALSDIAWMERNAARILKTRERLANGLPAAGFAPYPSRSNFILARRKNGTSARPVYQALKDRRILVRYFDTPRLSGGRVDLAARRGAAEDSSWQAARTRSAADRARAPAGTRSGAVVGCACR